jgi:hypothetical protein
MLEYKSFDEEKARELPRLGASPTSRKLNPPTPGAYNPLQDKGLQVDVGFFEGAVADRIV